MAERIINYRLKHINQLYLKADHNVIKPLKKSNDLLIVSSIILLLIVLFKINNKVEIDPEILEHIALDSSGSPQEKEKRQYVTLIMFQQTGFIYTFMLISVGFSIYQNRYAFKRYKRNLTKAFNKSSVTTGKTLAERLVFTYPHLTANDLTLCDLLYKGLSSKEIALQFNISPSSANTARYRLRKKLNIPSDEELITFLLKI